MKCSRCQAELSDSATYCTTCGTPTRVSVPTQFSYLPAGTPPWPSSVPQGLSFTTNATPTLTTQAPATPTKSRMSTRGIFTAIAVLILVPLLGAGITFTSLYANGTFNSAPVQTVHIPTPAPSATPATASTPTTSGSTGATSNQLPAASSFQKATGTTNIGVNFKYPGNWAEDAPQASTTSNYVRLHPQQQQYGIVFVLERFSASTSTSFTSATDLNTQLLQSISTATGVHNLQPIQASTPQRSIAGANWSEQDTSYTDDGGNKIRLSTISVQHNKLYYTILVISPDLYYNEAMQKYIQPMFDSLQFLT